MSIERYDILLKRLLAVSVLSIVAFTSRLPAAPIDSSIDAGFQLQYQELSDEIGSYKKNLSKRTVHDDGPILDRHALILDEDNSPLDVVIRRTESLLARLKNRHKNVTTAHFEQRLADLKSKVSRPLLAKTGSGTTDRSLFLLASRLRREIALANPVIGFDTILFAGVVKAGGTIHMCDQYLGWNAKNGGGLFLLTGVKSGKTATVNLLENATVTSGAMKGKKLTNGAVLSPDLSFDGKEAVFAWTNESDKCYHIFKINVDGTDLVQLTEGKAPDNGRANESHNDFDPCFLPNGRIAFISERRGGYGRCHPRNVPTFTLYSMKPDGSDIVCMSYHETNEWHPSINNQGQIVFTRWDYLDRDDCIAHHLWLCDPDGSNPRAPHGNYPTPLTTMQGSSWSDGRASRPNGEWNIRAIPGSFKYVATASGHHTHSFGQLIMIDINKKDDGKMAQVTGITTNQTRWSDTDGPYGTAWPLDEEFFLCNYNSQIVLLDAAGNREILYSTTGSARPIDPIPVQPRKVPPVISQKSWQGERAGKPGHNRATLSIMNVYNSDLPLGMDSGITALRIIQVFPQFTPLINQPRIGYAAESLARMVLGTVPVEPDGSVYCEAPVGKEIYFQLLDAKGKAVQSMRAGAFVHPGEQITCLGCHEDKWEAPPSMGMPLAFTRAPSKLVPEAGGVEPVNFYRLAKPVLAGKCAPCHTEKKSGPAMSYTSLEKYAFWWPGPGNPYVNGDITTAKHGGSRTIPGKFGAIASPLLKHLDPSHNNVKLTDEEIRRITLWLDCNSNELGAYTKVADQKSGKLVWPELDIDPANPTGVESDRPLASNTDVKKRLAAYITPKTQRSISAYYSAVTQTLTIRLNSPAKAVSVQLFDVAGRKIFSIKQQSIAHKSIVIKGITTVPSGYLIAKIQLESGVVTVPIVKI